MKVNRLRMIRAWNSPEVFSPAQNLFLYCMNSWSPGVTTLSVDSNYIGASYTIVVATVHDIASPGKSQEYTNILSTGFTSHIGRPEQEFPFLHFDESVV